MNQRVHLVRAISKLGLGSRSQAARWIGDGKVKVNGAPAESPEQWVELGRDAIEVDGLDRGGAGLSVAVPARVYLALHKPAGYVTTRSDELGRKTVYDLLPEELRAGWVFPVGRLDRESEGLLLMTDDGEWSNRLTDPESHVDKVYRVKLDGRPNPAELEAFRAGMTVSGRKTRPAEIAEEGADWYRVTLREGRNRQIRRMFHALGYKVKRLIRVSIGSLALGDMEPGEVRVLGPETAEALGWRVEP